MRVSKVIGLLLFLLPSAAVAQDFLPYKDLAFAQIAAGGGYETVLNLTNRGTSAYNGSLTLAPSDPSKPFPLLVNGNPVAGPLNVAVAPGATASLRITSGNATAGAVSGFAVFRSADRDQTTLLEGNLTYYVISSDGKIVDSVGVAPSSEVFQTVIPFDDFLTVALALANQNGANQPAALKLTLFDDKNASLGTANQPLANNQQAAQFLYQYFPGVTLTKGRVEIQSDRQFFGTALTFVKGSQASSLPFLPSMKAYNYTISVVGQTFAGKLYLAIDGPLATSYVRSDSPASGIDLAGGFLKNGNLELYTHGGRGGSTELIIYGLITGFNPQQNSQSGQVVAYFVNPPGAAGQGTITITAIN